MDNLLSLSSKTKWKTDKHNQQPQYVLVELLENYKEHKAMKETLENINRNVEYVSFDKNKLEGTYLRYPERSELSQEINESLVVEFYNK